ncbi:transposase [Candidatus Daviesbacteria bacterium]|nr:transposase [Candidatus Daviesbacteria bacterium]
MPYRIPGFENFAFYHLFNRGVNKQDIYGIGSDYQRFIQTLIYYQYSGPKPKFSNQNRFKLKDFRNNSKIVNLVCYCLMPNHFHLLIQQATEGGIREFMGKLSNSYTKYFNTRHNRTGPLFQGEFKAVLVESDEQLIHVSRYIHLNPYVSEITKNLNFYPYSSFLEYSNPSSSEICTKQPILQFFQKNSYGNFIHDYEDYALRLKQITHLLIDLE